MCVCGWLRVPAAVGACPKIAMLFDVCKCDLKSLLRSPFDITIDQVRLFVYEVCVSCRVFRVENRCLNTHDP